MSTLERQVAETKATLATIADRMHKFPPDIQADLAAHLRTISQQSTQMVDGWYRGETLVTPGLKQVLRNKAKPTQKGLTVLGINFQAQFLPITMNVLDQKALRLTHPNVVADFTRPIKSERLNFSPRTR